MRSPPHVLRILAFAAILLAALPGMPSGPRAVAQGFRLDFGAPRTLVARDPPASTVDVTCLLYPSRAAPFGAEGWRIEVEVTGWSVVEATTRGTQAALSNAVPPGLRDETGFETTRVDVADNFSRVTSTVLLSRDGVALDPAMGPSSILSLRLAGSRPANGDPCATTRLVYANEPGANRIFARSDTFTPALSARPIGVCPRECAEPTQHIILTDRPVTAAGRQTATVDWGLLTPSRDEPLRITFPRDEPFATLYAGIVSRGDPTHRIQAWSLSVSIDGDIALFGVSTAETAAETVANGGLVDGGFEVTDRIDPHRPHPFTGAPQGEGVVSAVVLSLKGPDALLPRGTTTVLSITVARGPTEGEGWLRWRDGLRGRGDEPVHSVATANSRAAVFCSMQEALIRFEGESRFVRCDANGDRGLDLSDAVAMLGVLFQGSRSECPDAVDCNADGERNISDPISLLVFLFGGGLPPPPPYPRCGEADTPGTFCDAGVPCL